MNTERKKELIQAWKERRPEMGILSVRCKENGAVFLGVTQDTNARLNRLRFQLANGDETNRQLQALWKQYGAESFEISVLKTLKYDDPKDDHTEELEALLEQCLSEYPQAGMLGR